MDLRKKLTQISNSSANELKKLISDELIKNLDQKIFLHIDEISKKCYTTKSTITKFAKSLGYEGYKELILRLKFERENYSAFDDRETRIEKYEDVKNFYIEILNYFDRYKKEFSMLNDLIKKEVQIISSSQLMESAEMLSYMLRRKQYQVDFVKYIIPKKFLNINDTRKVFIIFASGIDTSYIEKIYSEIKNTHKIIIITSFALSSHFDKYNVKFIIDNSEKSIPYFKRVPIVNYLVAQIICNIE